MACKEEIRVGHSPDSDDAFMFYALAKNIIPTGNFDFTHVIEDIESLNQRALKGELEVTAISVHAYAYIADKYALLPCGASIGDRYGPIIVSATPMALEELEGKTIAIPGTMTTAYLACRLCLSNFNYKIVPFNQIMDAVVQGQVDALRHDHQVARVVEPSPGLGDHVVDVDSRFDVTDALHTQHARLAVLGQKPGQNFAPLPVELPPLGCRRPEVEVRRHVCGG